MKFIIGLGNPGIEYKDSRHNAGFIVLDALLEAGPNFAGPGSTSDGAKLKYNKRFKAEVAKDGEIVYIKPMDYMNNSGQVVRSVVDFYEGQPNLDDIFVIHDDLDLELGQFKIVKGKGPKIHNGLLDLYKNLGGMDFWHLRVGVDSRGGKRTIPGHDYVLQRFSASEMKKFKAIQGDIIRDLKEKVYT